MSVRRRSLGSAHGYAMAAILVGLAVMSVALSIALPAWRTVIKREKEEELIFRGQQYVRAIALYQRKFANAYPPSIDLLLEQRFLRKKYVDPMTKDGEFQLLYQTMGATQGGGQAGGRGRGNQPMFSTPRAGETTQSPASSPVTTPPSSFGSQPAGPRGGIVGVTSKSTDQSLRTYNGRTHYNEWQFVYSQTGPGGRGSTQPGVVPGRRGGGPPRQPTAPPGRGGTIRPPG